MENEGKIKQKRVGRGVGNITKMNVGSVNET